jgi:endo-1,4-beta-D-glucanase Y
MRRIINLWILTGGLFCAYPVQAQQAGRPFPQHTSYHAGAILPSHISQQQMDNSVRIFYTEWKKRYIKEGCSEGEYYIWFERAGNKQCVSEGQGYGMIIVALMAGCDSAAHTVYDGLFRYYKAHPSKNSASLMAWAQVRHCRDLDKTSATDGDMDIAWSLLLADAQWGSRGAIDYRGEARAMTGAILQQEINQQTFSVLLSNAVEYDSKDYFDMRSSDFMPAHYRAFLTAAHDTSWNKVIDRNYNLFHALQTTYSPDAGLVPDFIQHINTGARPARAGYMESQYDGYYNYNACRVPWRIATDYLLYGDARAYRFVEKINHWIVETTGGNPDNISAGYSLAGDDMRSRHFEAMSFIASFAVAAMVDAKHQSWLNKIWDYIFSFGIAEFDYYDNSIKMIGILLLSGNYWAPPAA